MASDAAQKLVNFSASSKALFELQLNDNYAELSQSTGVRLVYNGNMLLDMVGVVGFAHVAMATVKYKSVWKNFRNNEIQAIAKHLPNANWPFCLLLHAQQADHYCALHHHG